MLWRGGRQSTNVEDRSGMRLGRGIVGGGIGSVILVLIGLFFGIDPGSIINSGSNEADFTVDSPTSSPVEDSTKQFIRTVVGYTEDTWSEIFQKEGLTYHPPKLILYSDEVDTACGFGQ